MRYLSIKNFAKHQHYKDRRPPWIKLHVEVLDDYAFACLQDASKAHLMLLWVLASKMDNRIPYDLPFLSRKLGTTSHIDVEELVLQGFIEVSQDDGKALAPRKQSAMPETEGETEAETQKTSPQKAAAGRTVVVRPPTEPAFALAPYLDAHEERFPGAQVPTGRFGKVLKGLERKHGPAETLRRWKIFLPVKGELGPEYFGRTWSDWDRPPASGPQNGTRAFAADPADKAWDDVLAMIPAWQRREITADIHAALPLPTKRGLSKIGGFRNLAETPDAKRVWMKKEFATAYHAASTEHAHA